MVNFIDKSKQNTNEIWKIVAAIVIGIVVAIAFGYITDHILTSFAPQYKPYESLINEGVEAAIVLIIGLFITSSIIKYVEKKVTTTKASMYGVALIIRIVMYVILFAIILSIFKVSITGILAGSAIGGVVLGLAVQTIASNLLAGLFVSSTRAIKYGDIVNINSWIWSLNTIGKIIEVKTLFSKMVTKDGNVVSIPNSALLGNSIIIEYKDSKGHYEYPVDVLVNADVPLEMVIANAAKKLGNKNIYIASKNGINNTLHVIINFEDVADINSEIDKANKAIDAAYWEIKNNIVILGPYATALYGSDYKITASLPMDVSPEQMIKEAKKYNIKLYLVSKATTSNTYVASFKPSGKIEDDISDANLKIEKIYQSLKVKENKSKKAAI
ncbi:MAG: mechanosensitive ion channel family protein [Methanothrix sp.]